MWSMRDRHLRATPAVAQAAQAMKKPLAIKGLNSFCR
jgi:hypothetical protein